MIPSPRPISRPEAGGSRADALRELDPAVRFPHLIGAPGDARHQARLLAGLKLAFVAVGSVLSNGVLHAGRLGIARLLLVDPGRLKEESTRTYACLPEDIGRAKVEVLGERAKALHPATEVHAFEGRFEALPLDVLVGYDHVLLAPDQLSCELEVAQRTRALGIPLTNAAVYGPTLTAQVRHVAHVPEAPGPCLCCHYGPDEWDQVDRQSVHSCAGEPQAGAPTRSFSFLCAIAAELALCEVKKRALGFGDPKESFQLDYNAYTQEIQRSPLGRNAACRLDHTPWTVREAESEAIHWPLGEVFRRAKLQAPVAELVVRVDGHRFGSEVGCACERGPRFVPDAADARCPRCGSPFDTSATFVQADVHAGALAALQGRSLAQLGVGAPAPVLIRGPRATVLFPRNERHHGDPA